MRTPAALVSAVVVSLAFIVWAAQPVAYITEIQRAGGDVHVRAAGEQEWKTPRPLLPLSPGDQVRVTGQAKVVVLYHADGQTVTLTSANSPLTVTLAADTRRSDQVRVVTAAITQFFLGKQNTPQLRQAATRGDSVLIISPRHTRLLPGPVTFEWEGPEHLRYGVRVEGPSGLVWRATDLTRVPQRYPASAPQLVPGVRYSWKLEMAQHPAQETQFEIMTEADAARSQAALATLEGTTRGYPRTNAAVMRAELQ